MSCNEETEQRNSVSSITRITAIYLDKYRRFLQRNRFALSLAEDGLGRLVLYAPRRIVSQSEENLYNNNGKILPETLYACINLWSLLNDTIYHGFGEGNGLTVGTVDQPFDGLSSSKMETRGKAILLLRAILSVIECMAPSLEVSAYSKNDWKRRSTHHRHLNALFMSSKIERVKFICRIGILTLNYYERIIFLASRKDSAMHVLSSLGILEEGGLLEPNEHLTHSKHEHERIKKLLYVGKRTGRQMRYDENQVQSNMPIIATATPGVKIGMVLLGDLLHIYRPLYYVQSSLRNERIGGSKGRHAMIKSWVISLVLDLLSQRLIIAGKTVHKGSDGHAVNIFSTSTKEELYHRKMRLALYLLRSPIWTMATYPIAEKISRVLAHVPLIGQPLVDYIMDVFNYWSKWHFMLENWNTKYQLIAMDYHRPPRLHVLIWFSLWFDSVP